MSNILLIPGPIGFMIAAAIMTLGILAIGIIVAPWIGYIVDKYWNWCSNIIKKW